MSKAVNAEGKEQVVNGQSEILRAVYKTFSNLERDYKRSKKSRSQFIMDKFGGDIEMGSLIILETISAEYKSAEEVEMLSFIRDIFAKLEEAQDHLDSLPNFDFKESAVGVVADLCELLEMSRRTEQQETTVQPFQFEEATVYHYVATKDGISIVPREFWNNISVFNNGMAMLAETTFGYQGTPKIGETLLTRVNGRYVE